MITISEAARTQLLDRGGGEGLIRIVVQSGGCAGMTYHAEIVAKKQEHEKIIKRDRGLTVITDDDSLPYLIGLQLDYSDDLITAGFRFYNGSNKSSCGCGASFSTGGQPLFKDEGAGCGA
ncbi:HesB/IscA family protein [Desulfofustis glycolicus]|uniref:Iron-sulfur cluster assembly protein n=1 Tax=Desulfofustis glycolicus DSM 9705 TaxID=1121409 RepID=A0A1M5XDB6_9BACT|nr:iron-sulfur cluster assembly accessory protein [Desulfofustis glycolicus]MCB2217927.1 iron-sulfur cluster assembly accessory protein [Desulfobulbaceae bacterium]SHH97759.1 iron-sulfur cluster assembly protein [Desulfofustis glycolicus DSM 9705]